MIDNIIIFLYFIIIFCIGVYSSSNVKNFKYYTKLKNTNISTFTLIATIFASSIGGGTIFGISEKAFSGNISYTYGLIIATITDILIAVYCIPKLTKHFNAQTVGDIIFEYYGNIGRIIAGTASVIISVSLLAMQINISGHILEYILGMEYIYGLVISYLIIIFYTTLGGFQSILFTNVMQFILMALSIILITVIGINVIGIDNLISKFPIDKIYSDNNLLEDTVSITLSFIFLGLYPNIIQRILIKKDYHTTRKAIYIKSCISIIFLLLITFNGILAYMLFPDNNSTVILSYLISQLAPTGLYGIIIVGLLAAVMSTADSDLHIISTSFSKDILNTIFNIKNNNFLLLITRISNVIVGMGSIIIALNFKNVIEILIFSSVFWTPIIIVPLIFALFNITVSKTLFVLNSIITVPVALLCEFILKNYYSIKLSSLFIAVLISIIVFSIMKIKKS